MLPSLKVQARDFHERLSRIKQETTLPHETAQWYPWNSLAQFDVLDGFLKGDTGGLLRLIGSDPVLDVGCGDGDIAFFLESLGARVDAVDYEPANYNALIGVRRLREILKSPLTILASDIDTQPVFPGDNYGFALMLGVLYHLKNPFLVLEALARRARYAFFSTRIAQRGPDRKTDYGQFPVAYLVEEDELNEDDTNFWIFTDVGFRRVVRRAGWDVLRYVAVGPVDTSDPISPQGDARAYILAKSRLAAVYRLLDGWHQMEADDWRWTARRFSVEMDHELALENAHLRFAFHLPASVLAAHPQVRLRAYVAGRELAETAYDTKGNHEYRAAIGALPAGPVRVDFEVDRALGPTASDLRELGVRVRFLGPPPVGIA